MENFFLFLGLAFVIIGILIIVAAALLGKGEGKAEVGIGGFIGPIPFGFATNKGMLYLVIALSIIILAVFLVVGR
ncbi:MAG: DUF131 domain-containing protein [Candidatus Aenigmatarchaeota archaeon]